MGGNPVYDAPSDLNFADALKSSNVAMRVYLGLYQNETAQLCHWNINEAHYLESWGDARAYDGTVSLVQPLIAPLYSGRSAHELMSALLGAPDATGYDIVRAYWQKQRTNGDFEAFWRKSLNDGSWWIRRLRQSNLFQDISVTISSLHLRWLSSLCQTPTPTLSK